MLRFRMRRRFWVYLVVCVLVPAALGALIRETAGAPDQVARIAPFLGYVLITIGRIVTSEVSIGDARHQHTITLITQHAFDPQRAGNRDVIKRTLPNDRTKLRASPAVDFDDETSSLTKAIDLELNVYEFLAVGAANGNLDESLIKQSLGSQFMAFYVQVEDYVVHWRGKNVETWRELSGMYTLWLGV